MNLRIVEINHIALHVANVPQSIEFYETKLGLSRLPRPNFDFDGAWFKLGKNQELHLIEGRTKAVIQGSRATHFALQVVSFQETLQYLQHNQITHQPPKQRPDGVWQVFLKDPDGYTIELTEIPSNL
jgi:catechol 2,3-dioxygenase-like lactoylglutathione lyase family enzyme